MKTILLTVAIFIPCVAFIILSGWFAYLNKWYWWVPVIAAVFTASMSVNINNVEKND